MTCFRVLKTVGKHALGVTQWTRRKSSHKGIYHHKDLRPCLNSYIYENIFNGKATEQYAETEDSVMVFLRK